VSPEGNTRIQLSGEALKQAQSRSAQRARRCCRISKPPHDRTDGQPGGHGIHISVPIPGFVFPTFVGPFTTMDARATVTRACSTSVQSNASRRPRWGFGGPLGCR